MVDVAMELAGTERVLGDAESVNEGALGMELRSLINGWPVGEPHPVVRS